jgi:hypothetical protein
MGHGRARGANMAQSDLGSGSGALDVGQVISDAAGVLRQNWAAYLLLSVVFVGLPSVLSTWEVERLVAQHMLTRANPASGFLIGFARSFPVSVASCVAQAAIMQGGMAYFEGRRRSLSEGLMTGLRYWIPLLALELMRSVAVDLGLLAFLVPGVMLNVAWWVSGPVLVTEHVSPIAAVLRSAELTRGKRWSIFGLAIIVGVFGLMLGFAGGLIGGFVFGFLKAFGVRAFSAQVLAYPLTYMFSIPIGSAIVVAAYRQLSGRSGEADTLAQVFA